MTKSKIEKLANEIRTFLDDNFLNGDVRIYFNGKALSHGEEDSCITWNNEIKDYEDKPSRTPWTVIENIDPKEYFDYTSDILCMSFEGSLYDCLNGCTAYDGKIYDKLQNIFNKYGCYFELGNYWNLAAFEN